MSLHLMGNFGMRPNKVKKVVDFSMKDKGWDKSRGEEGRSRKQMDESAHIHGKPGFCWENLKLSFCGVWELNSQLLIECINCNHKGISQ